MITTTTTEAGAARAISDAAAELQRSAAALRRARLHLEAGDLGSAEAERVQAEAGVQAAYALLARIEIGTQLREGV